MVQLCPSSVASPKTPKMAKSKTPKKSSAVDTPAKAAVQTPKMKKEALKEAKATPKAALQTPKSKKEALIKEAKSTPKAAPQTPKNGTASAKKAKKVKTPKPKPVEDVEMPVEGEEEEEEEAASPVEAQSPEKEASSEDAEMSSDEEEIEVKSKSSKSAPEQKAHPKMVGKFGLFVRALNYNTKEAAVSSHFSQFGTVTKCTIPRNSAKKGINKGFGFVEFDSQESLDKAIAAAHTLDGRSLVVNKNDPEAAVKRKREDSDNTGGDQKRQMTTHEHEVFVARLGFSTTKDAVKEHFSQFGEVVSIGLPLKPNKTENKGFAFVAFKEASSVQKAIADSNQVVDGSKLVVEPRKKSVAKEALPKPSHPNELFVGGLANGTQRHTLQEHFCKYGKITNVTLPWNKQGNRNKGFGFISFESAASLQAALEEEHEIDGKKIGVKAAGSASEGSASPKKAEAKQVKGVAKKVKAAAAAAKVEEDDDEEMESEEAEGESDEDEAEDEEVEGEDEEVEGEDEEVEGEDDDEDDDEDDEDDE